MKDVIVVGNFMDVNAFFGDPDNFFKEELKKFGLNPIKYIDTNEDSCMTICIDKENYEAHYFRFNTTTTTITSNGETVSGVRISLKRAEILDKMSLF